MDSILALLSPEQVDAILEVFDTVEQWYDQAVIVISDTLDAIVIEDVML